MREGVGLDMANRILEMDDKPKAPVAVEETELVPFAYGRSFHINFYSSEDQYRGKITLLGSDRKRILRGVDAAAIADFITQNLPPLARETIGAPFIEEIKLLQEGRVVGRADPLRAWKHFFIHVRLNFPSAQIADAFDDCEKTYAVQAWILNEEQRHVVASNAEGSTLHPTFGSNEISIGMGGLQPAKYVIKIQLILPLSRVKKSTTIDLRVDP